MHLYMVQRPKSTSNKGTSYRIVLHDDWLTWLDDPGPAATRPAIPAVGEYTTYQEAAVVTDRLNAQLRAEREVVAA